MSLYCAEIQINRTRIALDAPTYFIADIAANHDSDLQRAQHLIHLAAQAGANAAKFQHFKAESIVSDYGFKQLGGQLSHQKAWKKSVYEVYQDASLQAEWTATLKASCEQAGIDFFTSPYAQDMVEAVGPDLPAYKIGSGDITFLSLVEHIAKKNKPVLLATGASTLEEVKRAVACIVHHNPQVVLMQCNTNYTASRDNFKYIQLQVLSTYQREYPGMILGLSDHTPGHSTVLGAIALGARVIEKHFTDDNSRTGPDHLFSMNPTSWRDMVERSRELEMALGDGVKTIEANEQETARLQRRCLRLVRDLPAGSVLAAADLEALRPVHPGSYEPFRLHELVGKRLLAAQPAGYAPVATDLAAEQ